MLRQWFKRQAPTPKFARRARPRLECLEERAVPALYAFTILPDSSSLSLSGDVGGSAVTAQGMGALTARIGGSVVADFDATAGTISFLRTGTTAVAENSGSWAPLPGGASGTAPANFGGRVNVFGLDSLAAIRNAEVTAFTAAPLPTLDFGGGIYVFSSVQRLEITRGAADYNAAGLLTGTLNLAGQNRDNMASEGLFVDLVQIDPSLVGLYLIYAPIRLDLSVSIGGIVDANLSIRGTVIGLGTAVAPAPGAGGFEQPGLAYLAMTDVEADPVAPITGSVEVADPFQVTPADPAPAARVEVAPPVSGAAVQPAVADELFADPFVAW